MYDPWSDDRVSTSTELAITSTLSRFGNMPLGDLAKESRLSTRQTIRVINSLQKKQILLFNTLGKKKVYSLASAANEPFLFSPKENEDLAEPPEFFLDSEKIIDLDVFPDILSYDNLTDVKVSYDILSEKKLQKPECMTICHTETPIPAEQGVSAILNIRARTYAPVHAPALSNNSSSKEEIQKEKKEEKIEKEERQESWDQVFGQRVEAKLEAASQKLSFGEPKNRSTREVLVLPPEDLELSPKMIEIAKSTWRSLGFAGYADKVYERHAENQFRLFKNHEFKRKSGSKNDWQRTWTTWVSRNWSVSKNELENVKTGLEVEEYERERERIEKIAAKQREEMNDPVRRAEEQTKAQQHMKMFFEERAWRDSTGDFQTPYTPSEAILNYKVEPQPVMTQLELDEAEQRYIDATDLMVPMNPWLEQELPKWRERYLLEKRKSKNRMAYIDKYQGWVKERRKIYSTLTEAEREDLEEKAAKLRRAIAQENEFEDPSNLEFVRPDLRLYCRPNAENIFRQS